MTLSPTIDRALSGPDRDSPAQDCAPVPLPNPIRILHIVGHRMHWGGTETWLMHVLRRIDRTRFQMDFLVHSTEQWAFDEEVQAIGATIIPCPHPSRPWSYARRFAAVLNTRGPYHVVHSHVHHFSGYIARLAYRAGVPARIAHSHCGTAAVDEKAGLVRRIYVNRMRSWIDRYATCGLAASEQAAIALYGPHWRSDPRWKVLYCGIDLKPFRVPVNRARVKAELGIPQNAFVLGHVGMFGPPKNHGFLVRIAASLIRQRPDVFLLLIGDGPLRPSIESEVSRMGISKHVLFCGTRDDVPKLMLGAMDLFVFPSLWEGLALSFIEAQAAGLPCVISDVITKEADVLPELITRLSPTEPIVVWTDEIVRLLVHPPAVPVAQATDLVAKSPFNGDTSSPALEQLYANLLDESPVYPGR